MRKNLVFLVVIFLTYLLHVSGGFANADPLNIHAAQGTLFYITGESVGLPGGFTAKPDIFVTRNDDSTEYRYPLEVMADTEYFQDHSVDRIACYMQIHLTSGIYSLWLRQPEDVSRSGTDSPIMVTDRFIVEEPIITSVLRIADGNRPAATIAGRFFGAEGVQIWIVPKKNRCIREADLSARQPDIQHYHFWWYRRCKILQPLPFANAFAQPGTSAMDPRTGSSTLSFFLPSMLFKPGEYTLRLRNPAGMETTTVFRVDQSRDQVNVSLTVDPEPAACVTSPEAEAPFLVNAGDTLVLTATPTSHYTFTQWTADGDVVFENPQALETRAVIHGDAVITAHCMADAILKFKVSPEGTGATVPLPDEILLVKPGDTVDISADSFTGWTFSGWTASENALLNNSMALNTTVALTGDAEVTANFVKTGTSGVKFGGLVSATADVRQTEDGVQPFILLNWTPALCVDTPREDVRYLIYAGASGAVEELCREENLASSVTGALGARIAAPTGLESVHIQAVAVDRHGNASLPRQPLKVSVGDPMVYCGKLINLSQLADAYDYDVDQDIVTLKGNYWNDIRYGDTVLATPEKGPSRVRKVRLLYLNDNDDTVIWLEEGNLSDVIESGTINGDLLMDSSLSETLEPAGPEARDDPLWGRWIADEQSKGHRVYQDPENRMLYIDRSPLPLPDSSARDHFQRAIFDIAPGVTLELTQSASAGLKYSIPIKNRTLNHLSFNARVKYHLKGRLTIDGKGWHDFKKQIRLYEAEHVCRPIKNIDDLKADPAALLFKWVRYEVLMDVSFKGKSDMKYVEEFEANLDYRVDFVWDIFKKWQCDIKGPDEKSMTGKVRSDGDLRGSLVMSIANNCRFEVLEDLGGWYYERDYFTIYAEANSNYFNQLNVSEFRLWLQRKIDVFAEAEPFNMASLVIRPYRYQTITDLRELFSTPSLGTLWVYDIGNTEEGTRKRLANATWIDGVNNPIVGYRWNLYKSAGAKTDGETPRNTPPLDVWKYRRWPMSEPNPYGQWVNSVDIDISVPEIDPEEPYELRTYFVRARPWCPLSPFMTEEWKIIEVIFPAEEK